MTASFGVPLIRNRKDRIFGVVIVEGEVLKTLIYTCHHECR